MDVPIFLAATASVCAFYVLSQKEQFPATWKSKLKYIPAVLGIGIGHQPQQRDRRARGPVRQAVRVHPHAEVPDRGRGRRPGRQKIYKGKDQLGCRTSSSRSPATSPSSTSTRSRTGSSARCPSSRSSSGASCTPRACRWPRASTGSCRASRRPAARAGRRRIRGRSVDGLDRHRTSRATRRAPGPLDHPRPEPRRERRQGGRRPPLGQPRDGRRRLPQPRRRLEQRDRPDRRGVRLRAARPPPTRTATASSRPRPRS